MSNPSPSTSSGIGRGTVFVLSFFLLLCIGLIGFSGYAKYELDRAETALTAPAMDTAEAQQAAENQFKLWATVLTFMTWSSLIVGAACLAGIYLAMQGKQAAPLRALTQSVQNLARGDMRTPVWGQERSDALGELARALDLARYHFSQLPDMSVLSEDGPMRIRFEGTARSLFEAMMQGITRDSEYIRVQAAALAESIDQQKEAIARVSGRVETALGAIFNERRDGEAQIKQLMQGLGNTAQSLAGSQEAASARINQLIAYMQDRAHGMAEVTQIAGKQVAQTLLALSHTEQNLRSSAARSGETVEKLAVSANELGERMFGAVNLLQAGGKVLTDTAEATQSRLNEAIHLMNQSETGLRQMLAQGFEPVGQKPAVAPDLHREETERLQGIVHGLESAQRKLEECLAQQSQAAQAQIELLTTNSASLLTQASTTAQTLATVTDHLRSEQDKFDQASSRFTGVIENIGERIEKRAMESFAKAENAMQGLNRLTELAAQLGPMIDKLSRAATAEPRAASAAPENLLGEIRMGFEVSARSIERLREEFVGLTLKQASQPAVNIDGLWDRIAVQIDAARDNLAVLMMQQADRIEVRLASMDKKAPAAPAASSEPVVPPSLLEQQTKILSELASALGAIDAHMHEMETTFKNFNNAG